MIIADASGLISLVILSDSNHPRAVAASQKYIRESKTILVPTDVFSEFINTLGKKFGHNTAIEAAEYLLQNDMFLIENESENVLEGALKKYKVQPKSVSFTDCVVMAFADKYDTKEIFGFDEAFAQNGYTLPY